MKFKGQANIKQSLVPHYGFDGLGGQLGYLGMGGVGGAFGKTVLSGILNKNSWWIAKTTGPDFGPTETSNTFGDVRSGWTPLKTVC